MRFRSTMSLLAFATNRRYLVAATKSRMFFPIGSSLSVHLSGRKVLRRPSQWARFIGQLSLLTDGRVERIPVEFAVLPIHLQGSLDETQRAPFACGKGTLTLKSGDIDLTDAPATISIDELLRDEPILYSYLGRRYRFQYVGPRPVVWRFQGGLFSRNKIVCDAGDVSKWKIVEFRGTPGTAVKLSSSQGLVIDEAIGPEGRLSVRLSRMSSTPIGERLSVSYETPGAQCRASISWARRSRSTSTLA